VSNLQATGPGSERKLYLSLRRLSTTWETFRSDPAAWRLPLLLDRVRDLAERYANLHVEEEDDEQEAESP
jgi:hypothetical protein